jgi:DNA (cytosine-5)-methyltransferase 1
LLRQRIDDGILDEAPIFCDVRAFIGEGYAAAYTGMVDVVTAGFPCQPFSVAGKGQGEDDPRNMWPATIECIRIVRPRYALLENVPGLLAHEYIRRIFGELAESGYDARWACLDAQTEGAPIERERVFIACTNEMYGEARMGPFENGPITLLEGTGGQCPEFWLQTPSADIGMGNGMADYLDRVEAIGNGQVPQVVRTAWKALARN